ncbi:hypothetical protein [Micromonospora sediminicola]|uniref:hypothetical protein n=1 Tax=Micromonospora sediminicola TaxID=946078 RepID=UPI0037AF5083
MPGQPQPRESGRLYGPADPDVPVAMVRLEECMDGSGRWLLLVNRPARARTTRYEHPDQRSARAQLAEEYANLEPGQWWETTTRLPY